MSIQIGMRRRSFFLLLLFFGAEARGADRNEVRAINIALQPIFTMMGAALQGKLRTRDDVLRCLGTGMVAGYGFYEAKANAANGDVRAGWLIANAAASMSANAAAGRNPLSRLRVVVGPVRAEVKTGVGNDPDPAILHMGISLYELGALGYMYSQSDRMHWRDGMLTFSKRDYYPLEDVPREGLTAGIFPGLYLGASPQIREHEVIHTIQSLQLDSVEPPFCAFSHDGCDHDERRLVRWEVDFGVVPMLEVTALGLEDYQDRWSEVEAYRMAQDISPIP